MACLSHESVSPNDSTGSNSNDLIDWYKLAKRHERTTEKRMNDRETNGRQRNERTTEKQTAQQAAWINMLFVVSVYANQLSRWNSSRSIRLFVWFDLLRCVFVHCAGVLVCVWLRVGLSCFNTTHQHETTHKQEFPRNEQTHNATSQTTRFDRLEFQWLNRFIQAWIHMLFVVSIHANRLNRWNSCRSIRVVCALCRLSAVSLPVRDTISIMKTRD